MADLPAIRALRPFAVAGFSARSGGPFGELADDAQIGVLCNVPIFARDVRVALQVVEEASPVRTIRRRRWTRLKAALGCWFPHTGGPDGQEA